MPVDLINISSVSPNGTGVLTVPANLDITGTPAPSFMVNGVPLSFGGAVSSVFGRTGTVTAASGDYDATLITLSPQISTWTTVQGALGGLNTAVSNIVSSQWVNGTGGAIYYNGGNVGIGTSAPPANLAVRVAPNQNLQILNSYNASGFSMIQAVNDANSTVGPLQLHGSILALTGGNTGVNTSNPTLPLQVNGLNNPPYLNATSGVAGIVMSAALHELAIGGINANPWPVWIQTKNVNNNNWSYPLSINPLGGNVGIWTTNPQSPLDVNGAIRASGPTGVSYAEMTQAADAAYVHGWVSTSSLPLPLLLQANSGNQAIGGTVAIGIPIVTDIDRTRRIHIRGSDAGVSAGIRMEDISGEAFTTYVSSGGWGVWDDKRALSCLCVSTVGNVGVKTSVPTTALDIADGVDRRLHFSNMDWAGYGPAMGIAATDDFNNANVILAFWAQHFLFGFGVITMQGLENYNPGVGSKRLWYDPADGNIVKFAP